MSESRACARHLRIASGLLLGGAAVAGANLGDTSTLVQRDAFRPHSPKQGSSASTASHPACSSLPAALHYDYGKYAGAYGRSTVFWTDAEFRAVFEAEQQGNQELLVPLMQKLKQGGLLRMVVFGGSSTAGAGCFQNEVMAKECPWPRRFQHWLEMAFPEGDVELVNFAQGAATSSSVLAGAGIMLQAYQGGSKARRRPDIIFVDTLVNDVYQRQKEDNPRNNWTVDTNSAIAYEQLLRTLHKLEPQAVIFPVLSGCVICMKHGMEHREVISHYDLPCLDWGQFAAVKSNLWDGPDVHPLYYAHQSMADVLATQWRAAWQKYCANPEGRINQGRWPAPYFGHEQLDTFRPCTEPLSGYDASMPETAKDVKLGAGWLYYEDKPGKPGWISETPGSVMAFPVRFGEHPVLVITWMRSYDNMGTATMVLNGHEYILDGLWPLEFKERVSLSYTRWLQVDRPTIQTGSKEVGVAGFGVKPRSNLSLTIRLPIGRNLPYHKMKILQVFTC